MKLTRKLAIPFGILFLAVGGFLLSLLRWVPGEGPAQAFSLPEGRVISEPPFPAPAPSPSHPLVLPLRFEAEATTVSRGTSIQKVQQAAIRYAEVSPTKIQRWRQLARWRALIPKFKLGLDRDEKANVVSSTRKGVTQFTVGPERQNLSLDFDVTWDLGDLFWSPDQNSIDVRSRLMVILRQNILQEVTRLYFRRQRLMAEFQHQPSDDPILLSERQLRLEELAAQLDALTGGWYTKQSR